MDRVIAGLSLLLFSQLFNFQRDSTRVSDDLNEPFLFIEVHAEAFLGKKIQIFVFG